MRASQSKAGGNASTPAKPAGATPAKKGGRKRGRPPATPAASATDDTAPSAGAVARPRSYFDAHRTGGNRTSNCTLADMHLPSADVLLAALAAAPDPLADERASELRKATCARRTQQLLFQLHAGHSLLFFGFGSKRRVLSSLADALAEHYDVIELAGFNPSLSLRGALARLTDDVLAIRAPFAKRTVADYAAAVRAHIGERRVAVVVHNIDGPALRAPDWQRALAELAAVPGVLFAASVDHVNAPLLWDGAAWATFAWAWVNANTFAEYEAETVYASKAMLQGAGERRVEGAVILLNSLSVNARKVFRELAQGQVAPDADEAGGGKEAAKGAGTGAAAVVKRSTFNNLFESCRRGFICTDTTSLRSILTELETHDMLERRRGADAEEQIWVPLSATQLKLVLSQMDK